MLNLFRKFTAIVSAVGLALIIGCGQTGPISSQDDAVDQIEIPLSFHSDAIGIHLNDGIHRITLSAKTPADISEAMRLTKPAPLRRRSVSQVFVPRTARMMEVVFEPYVSGDRVQLRRARLKVKENAVLEPIEITMTAVSGRTLDDIEIIFQPHGFEFERPATLVLRLLGDNLTPADIAAYHISGATVDQIDYEFDEDIQRDVVRVILAVPGFSRYSLGGDR